MAQSLNLERIIIKNWSEGNLGLSLTGNAPTPPASSPLFTGNFKKKIDDNATTTSLLLGAFIKDQPE